MIEDTKRDTNIVDLLTDLQSQVESLKSEKKTIEAQLNSFRLGFFKIPLICDPVDENPYLTQAKGCIIDLLAKDNGLALVEKFMKRQLNFMSECSSFVEDYRSRNAIKIKIDKKHADGVANAEIERNKPRPHKGPLKLTSAEKAVRNVRKMFPHATMTQLVPFVVSFTPGMSEETARATIETYFAKEAISSKPK